MNAETPPAVAPARPDEVGMVLDLLDEAARFTAERGVPQWGAAERRGMEAYAAARAATGEVFLARLGDDVVATFTLQWADEEFWGPRPDDAGYLHRLAVRRDHAGRGIGLTLVRWAEAEVVRRGRRFLRLDCNAANPRMRRYYQDAGFVARGELRHPRFAVVLYEKEVTAAPSSGAAGTEPREDELRL